jgi:hypothetical protein
MGLFSLVPVQSILRCKIYRKKSKMDKVHPAFFMYNEADNNFMLGAKKRVMSKTPHYILSSNKNDLSKESGSYVGKLRYSL